ncbi:MAG: vanadium-dependent haloperoxidase [Ferruginibacter sp.]|nr:vanadium-dependent haloperoxidase [Ferruginibacter sp.]
MKTIIVLTLLLYTSTYGQSKRPLEPYLQVQPIIFSLSAVMIHDVVNPPAASRFYSYALLGAYEIVAQNDTSLPRLSAIIKSYTAINIKVPAAKYNYRIAAVYCILETGKRMLPSGYMLQAEEEKFIQTLKRNKISLSIIDSSIAVAVQMAENILTYAQTDGYGKLSAKLRYTPSKGDQYWYPTPPAYIEAVEPNWKTIRPMLIDSCNQFTPVPAVAFCKDSASTFYKMAAEVYDISKKLTPLQLHIASFWDCNPFVVNTSGHMAIGYKKISPGGHWMNITGIVGLKAGLDFNSVILLHTMISITLMDAFISCWDEKYRSNRIRPQTFINKYIDLKWQPLLQTPPFPEYTSGHSVLSTAAAEVLTYFMGDGFTYTDNSEDFFDIKPRSFTSFRQAAAEAAASRIYGGIHFRDAIENGVAQGLAIGDYEVKKIKALGFKPLIVSTAKRIAKK